ncbi:gliding motility-associated C-terminal domain-containing protein [Zhouia amylolytica]|uniref:Gliding motility-associated C-terminal domain-containing protein n=1 Tax=Zhouia amylolytica TaxID=376730 RepID=A0A1I6UNB7_9FLAO|nr:T9SS type B sorting domain-containing protein [Zhouia amylolytica]SFT02952.1 gliding motility-associated C-terminal domain-containing protein [Zhouia amylolytica]
MNLFKMLRCAFLLMPALFCYSQTSSGSTAVVSLEICSNESSVDLFTMLNADAVAGGVWSPSLSGGQGIFNPAVDNEGTYLYTVTTNYVTLYEVEVEVSVVDPIAATTTSTTLCSNAGPVDLIGFTNDTSNQGTWVPELSSGTSVFNPSVDEPGIYSYIASGACGTTVSEVYVEVIDTANSGISTSLSICEGSSPFNLFDALEGSPDLGGTWSPPLRNGSGYFDPQRDAPGVYSYTVGNDYCGYSSASVTVSIDQSPFAGSDAVADLCVNNGPVDLYAFLGDGPDAGGSWSPALSGGSGWFDPLTDQEGVYTYTISNGSCGMDTATVEVRLIDTNNQPNVSLAITDLSGNNSIHVQIPNRTNYHYSLDNINYQSSNSFTNLSGGKYTVYIREIEGCGFFHKEVVLLGGPKFFTPNGDGINDYWSLFDISNIDYTIKVFDRYGRPIDTFDNHSIGWDGTFNGNPLPSADYWFLVNFEDGTTKNGHFTLLR